MEFVELHLSKKPLKFELLLLERRLQCLEVRIHWLIRSGLGLVSARYLLISNRERAGCTFPAYIPEKN